YVRLARAEEREAIAEFGDAYRAYMKNVAGFLPRLDCVLARPSGQSGEGKPS
ncbi:MAG: isoprenylcysteine carboxylmethyltransferase family protein, partial [Mesorhizobium sp.]